MHQHQHGPNCRHGHGHGHGGHGGHGGHHGHHPLGFSNQAQQVSPQEYFKELNKKYNQNRIFFWQQILLGLALDKFYEKYGLNFMRSFSCNTPMMIIGSLQQAINFDCIPKQLKHITSGLFFPILFLLFFNFNVVVGIGNHNQTLRYLIWATLFVYIITGLRGSGQLNNSKIKQKCKQIYGIRPYMQNANTTCNACGIIKFFRSMHCPFCKSCVSKHTRHSVVFGVCIGAANQLFSLFFFALLWLTQLYILYIFFTTNTYGFITKIMFYLMNGTLCWMAFTQTATLFIFNIFYGVTETQLKSWPMQQHLIKVPQRQFQNNVGQSCLENLTNAIYATFGISGLESQNPSLPTPLSFPPIKPNQSYRINWAKATIYLIPFLPTHKNRQKITQLLLQQEPQVIQMYKLQKNFREEIIKESGGQSLNQFQIQQKLAMKMQAHMMKNMPPHMMQQHQQPTTDQQKTIQLQMLTHMKKQFASEADLAPLIDELHKQLSESQITAIQANMRMRQYQQQLMQRRISRAMKNNQDSQIQKKRQEEQQAPMVRVADEDL